MSEAGVAGAAAVLPLTDAGAECDCAAMAGELSVDLGLGGGPMTVSAIQGRGDADSALELSVAVAGLACVADVVLGCGVSRSMLSTSFAVMAAVDLRFIGFTIGDWRRRAEEVATERGACGFRFDALLAGLGKDTAAPDSMSTSKLRSSGEVATELDVVLGFV